IINYRRCLNSSEIIEEHKKNIIILRYNSLVAGLPVSRVRDVIYVNEDKFSAVPLFVGKEKMEFFKGIIEYRDKFIMVIKTETLLGNLKNKI
ncbi:MAG: chemotaxis protein CheW, partial [Nitrospira sp.]|nr:chemotaxis protein CheW [Nitrospira sp.]